MNDYTNASPKELRALFRSGTLHSQTSGMCAGFAQANLLVLPKEYAYDFLLFAQRNPKSCPILEVTEIGSRLSRHIAEADLATDLPRYRVFQNGKFQEERTDVRDLWRADLVAFLIGCSFSFEAELLQAGVPVRNIEENRNVPMYLTNIPCEPAGAFHGNQVVSMRPMRPDQAIRAAAVTTQMPRVHGAPVHLGNPEIIGISDLSRPDFGESVAIHKDEIPVFWACGVTPQAVVMASRPSFAITHAPGHMLITDIENSLLKN